jgi:hypothetical protein
MSGHARADQRLVDDNAAGKLIKTGAKVVGHARPAAVVDASGLNKVSSSVNLGMTEASIRRIFVSTQQPARRRSVACRA